MNIADFLRVYAVRSPNVMWFLGAGASAASGIPTASDMIWDFKRILYCTAQRVSIQSCSDLGSSVLRSRIQQHFDSVGGCPAENSDAEYAHYFEVAYPSEGDRRRYIDAMVSGAVPSFGHIALAALLKMDKARLVWTTNFDKIVEDAAISVLGSSSRLVLASLDGPDVAMHAMNEGRWPILVKLHGDFQSRRLRNTASELRTQDAELRAALVEGSRRYGLAVVGYSGRDHSVMDALEDAIDGGRGYPSGLFWFQHSQGACLPRVADLIQKASSNGIDAHIIESNTFDELLGDALLLLPDIPIEVQEQLNKFKRRLVDAPVPRPGTVWPMIRLNALPVMSSPSICRLVVCQIGGTKEVREAVASAGAEVLAVRRQVGILAFGRDDEIRKSFAGHDISKFDLHPIETHRLRYESAELGLIYDALCRALARERPVRVERRRSGYLIIADAGKIGNHAYDLLRSAAQRVVGIVPKTALRWGEAIRVRLEYRLDQLWLLFEPCIWLEKSNNKAEMLVAREFERRRLASRYNSEWNAIMNGWANVLVGPGEHIEICAFGIGDGVDARFTIGKKTGFSRRERK